jgi:hypothetical protein
LLCGALAAALVNLNRQNMSLAGHLMRLTALLRVGSTLWALLPWPLTWHDTFAALLHSLADYRLYISVQWVGCMQGIWVVHQVLHKLGPQPVGVAND